MKKNDLNDERLRKVETKLNWLLAIGAAQTIALLFICVWLVVSPLIPNFWTIMGLVIVLVAFLIVFRARIPFWFGMMSRWLFAQVIEAEEKDSMKDVN